MSRPEPLRTLPEQAFRARARLVALLLCEIGRASCRERV